MNLGKDEQVGLGLAAAGALLIGLLLLLNGGLRTAHAASNTRYVATTGDDTSNDCLDSSRPCATIQHAVDQAAAGDEIRVAQGNYTDLHASGGRTYIVRIAQDLTIRGGYTTTNWSVAYPLTQPTAINPQGCGGQGIVIAQNVSVTLEGLRVTNGISPDWGGGIMASAGTRLTIDRCWIYRNRSAKESGGIHIYSGTLNLRRSYVYSNTAVRDGGGVNFSHSSGELIDNSIYANTVISYGAGGVYLNDANHVTLRDNRIYSNSAGYYGGGVYAWYGGDVSLVGNDIHDNRAKALGGGGVFLRHSKGFALTGNRIYSNTAGSGGGGVYLSDGDNITLTNNMIVDNRLTLPSGAGAGLLLDSSDARLLHTTVARNGGGEGEGIRVNSHTLWLTNTILVSQAVGISATTGSAVTLTATLWGSGAWANGVDYGGGGSISTGAINIRGDPAFVDPDGGDYHLGPGSAAIDAGVDAGVTTDIDGDPRPLGAGYDIGADEFRYTVYLPLVIKNHP